MVFWFTGLSGAGKTTLSDALTKHLREKGFTVLQLDGDVVRTNLCSDLGFSMEDRNENIRRVASCAALAEKSGIITCVSCITPLQEQREMAKQITEKFLEVYIACSIDICRSRDPKGNYSKHIPSYTGVSSRYEEPVNPDLIIETGNESLAESIQKLINFADACIMQN